MKSILIAGGAGFLGSHLCKENINLGYKVYCLDNLSTGNFVNIKNLVSNKNFVFIEHNIINPIVIREDLDQIYNLACPASPTMYQKDPILTIKTNVLGVINLLELAKEKNSRILQASTSEVYGDPVIQPQTEEYWGNVNLLE